MGGSYCRLQMPLKLALGVRGAVAGHRLNALEGGGVGGSLPPFQCIPALEGVPCGVPAVGGGLVQWGAPLFMSSSRQIPFQRFSLLLLLSTTFV